MLCSCTVISTLSLLHLRSVSETMSTCSVASVHEMESATLTCDFSADISLTRQNVHVIHFDGRENKSNINNNKYIHTHRLSLI